MVLITVCHKFNVLEVTIIHFCLFGRACSSNIILRQSVLTEVLCVFPTLSRQMASSYFNSISTASFQRLFYSLFTNHLMLYNEFEKLIK
jgi:hypothetical protein